MQLIATYPNADDAAFAVKALEAASIPVTTRIDDSTGFEITELSVDDSLFDRGCEVIEKAEQDMEEARLAQSRAGKCPACGSRKIARCDDIDCSGSITGITHVTKCQDCGHMVAR